MSFNRVVIKNNTQDARNIHLSVHPFPVPSGIRMFMHKGGYTQSYSEDLPAWQTDLADELWDGIPGLNTLFFHNGSITIQHSGLFEDAEIIDAATRIITPFLQTQLTLDMLG